MTITPQRRRRVNPADVAQYAILAFVVIAALAGAFTHMHDWTIQAINAARVSRGLPADTAHWLGWANAVISELLPTSSFLSIRKRQAQGRSATVPSWIFIGSAAVSLFAQLSATGIRVPYDGPVLACLPALAFMILAKVILADVEYAGKARADADAAAERKAELARNERAAASELRRKQEQDRADRAAELAAERDRAATELAAELKRREAEQAAELDRERRAAELAAEERRARIEADAATERARIEAAERAAEREARERQVARDAAARLAAEVERARVAAESEAERARIAAEADAAKVRAWAARTEAEAEMKQQAAARLAAAAAERPTSVEPGGNDDPATRERRRRPAEETAALVDAVLATLADGTERPAAVAAVVAQLNVTAEYARRFVPAGFVAGSSVASSEASSEVDGASSVRRRHLTVASTA